MSSRYSSCFSLMSPNIRSRSTCENPRIALSGVRSSCDMFARNSDLCWLVASSSAYRRLSSSFIRLTFAAQRAQFVAVDHVDVSGEVAG